MNINHLEYLLVCCMCPTIKRHGYEYIMDLDFLTALKQKIENAGYMVSDGYCSKCKQKEIEKIREYFNTKK